ncbi:hypothetical protein HN014_04570 [Aquimarina sp. TRL1]|uniref:hypothetical protein n=1 Tax=Aquimarina sp. (strain TRL1) TaxID=2736252 RepID=UPI00158D73FA|nr:hypothetical protein [Aquimarina sp. TRL1]QKX04212.1 hypothetical protein HN014_04570 [Aquimarina sp. TRL1]
MNNLSIYKILLICCIGAIQLGHSQNTGVKELLNKALAFYQSEEQYQVDMTYTMYQGLTGSKATESYQGSIIKNKAVSQIKMLNTDILQFPEGQLTINHTEKTVVYTIPEISSIERQVVQLNTLMKNYTQGKTTEKGDVILCELTADSQSNQNPYSRVILHINKNTYRLEKQELFFSRLIPFVGDRGVKKLDHGRLIITFEYSEGVLSEGIDIKDYIVLKSSEDVFLTGDYQEYRLINRSH